MRKKDMVVNKGTKKVAHTGKGAVEEVLPSRHALNRLTNGDPFQRTMQHYAKATPMANPLADYDPTE